MTDNKPVRIDKFLWAVRIYKTRGQAISACKIGRILIGGINAKPSRIIERNEILTVRKPPVTYTYKVITPLGTRVSAKLVPDYMIDLTPESEKIKVIINRTDTSGFRKKGSGRPTKKERRIIDRLHNGYDDPLEGGIKT